MALKKLNLGVSDLTLGLLRDAEINLQQERPAILFQNEQLNKDNAILVSQNAQLQAETKELQNIINQWAPIVKQAQEIPELLVTLGKREKEVEILQQQLNEAKIFIAAAAKIPELQQQLHAKDDEIQKLQSLLETAKKTPKTPPQSTSAVRMPISTAENGRPFSKTCRDKSAASAVRPANTVKTRTSKTCPLAGPMARFMYLHKLAREMELFHMEPEEFCHLANLTIGFDMDMCRIFMKHIRKETKCLPYQGASFSFLDECRKDMEKVFSIPRMSRKNNAR